MLGYGIMTAPALIIDEKIVSQGRVLQSKDIEKLLNGIEIKNNSCDNGSCGCK